MQRKEFPNCPVEITSNFLNDKWKILIIRDLIDGPKRFGKLQKSVNGISTKVLTSNLKKMEEAGLINREVFPEVPLHVEYSLTDIGLSLKPVIDTMAQWGTTYRNKINKSKTD